MFYFHLVIWTSARRHGSLGPFRMSTPAPSKKYLTADDAKHIALPWCAVAEFVSVENAGSQDEEELKRKAVSMASLIGADISGIVDGWLNG